MMEWKKIAEARQVEIPEPEWAGTAAALDALEEAFRPLVPRLAPEDEPSPVFRAVEEPE